MLKPALLYKEQLEELEALSWTDMSKMYWHGGPYRYQLQIDQGRNDSYGRYQWACISSNKVVGYISYHIDWESMSAYSWAIVSYIDGPNITLMKDLGDKINELFTKNNIQRIDWRCYADNPFCKSYINFINKCGGRIAGILRRIGLLEDGKLHDSILFEILKEEWHYEIR
jgi:hypothetical protein